MHICFLTHEYPLWATGGIGSFIQTLGRELVMQGHRVTVVGVGVEKCIKEIDDNGVHIVRLASSTWNKLRFIPNILRIRKYLFRLHSIYPIDVVETPEQGLAFLSRHTPYKKIIRLHGGHYFFAEAEGRGINWWKGFQERISFKKADAFFAVSEYVKNHTEKYLSFHGRLVTVVPLPLDGSFFKPSDMNSIVSGRIVFAGTVCEKKGIRQLILALGHVIPKFPNVRLEVYGRNWYNHAGESYISYLKSVIDDSIMQYVNFHGAVSRSQMPEIYQQAELCVFPSHLETLGLVAPEAMLTGRPVIFSNTGPGSETIEHGKTGLLCNPHDEKDIAEKICFALSNMNLVEEMGRAGREFALAKFDLRSITKRNVELMREVCQ